MPITTNAFTRFTSHQVCKLTAGLALLVGSACTPLDQPGTHPDDTGTPGSIHLGGLATWPGLVQPDRGAWHVARSLDLMPEGRNFVGPIRVIEAADKVWVTSNHNPDILQVDLATKSIDQVLSIDSPAKSSPLAVDPQDGFFWIGGEGDHLLTRLDLNDGSREPNTGTGLDDVAALEWDPQAQSLYVWGDGRSGGELVILDRSGRSRHQVFGDRAVGLDLDSSTGLIGLTVEREDGTSWLYGVDSRTLQTLFRVDLVRATKDLLAVDGGVYYAVGPVIGVADANGNTRIAVSSSDVTGLTLDSGGVMWGMHRQAMVEPDVGDVIGTIVTIEPGTAKMSFNGGGNSQFMDWSPEQHLFISNSEATSEIVLTRQDGAQDRILLGYSAGIARSDPNDTQRVAVVDRLAGHVHFFDGDTEVARYDSDGWPADLRWSEDGSQVFVYEHHRDRVVSVDPDTGLGRVLFDDDDVNPAIVFGSILLDGDRLYLSSGGVDKVRAITTAGELLWETELGDPQPYINPDNPGSLDLGLDDSGNLWVSRSRDGRVICLDTEGNERGRFPLPHPTTIFGLFVQGHTVYVGPYRIDPDTIALAADTPLKAAAVRAQDEQQRLLLDDGTKLWWQGEAAYDHRDQVTLSNYQMNWEDTAGGVWLSQFALGKVQLLTQ